jgi:uncharacterized protein YndB with AHSA1/START domain
MSDKIVQTTRIRAPIDRVWRAVSDHREFGTWFKVALDQPFEVGQPSTGHFTYPGFEDMAWTVEVVAVEPPRRLAFRWHPHAVDRNRDYSSEPTTLVEFLLREVDDGTEVEVVESGFDAIPASRRDEAFRMNSGGWEEQARFLRDYVEG